MLGALLGLAYAIALGCFRFFGTKAPVHAAEWWIADLALAATFALPSLVALLAWRTERRHLLLAAAVVSFVLSVAFAVSLVTIPLVVPGILYAIAYRRRLPADGPAALSAGVLVAGALVGLAAIVLVPGRIVCWSETVYKDGRTVLVRDRASERRSTKGHFSQVSGPPQAGVAEESGGCTDGAVRPPASLAALGVVAGALVAVARLR